MKTRTHNYDNKTFLFSSNFIIEKGEVSYVGARTTQAFEYLKHNFETDNRGRAVIVENPVYFGQVLAGLELSLTLTKT